jgi:hypothetical protein
VRIVRVIAACIQILHMISSFLLSSLQRMEPSNENLRFYVIVETMRGVSATDILEQLISVFSDRAPSRAFVFKWWKAYSEGTSTSVKTMPPMDRPVSVTTPANTHSLGGADWLL